MVPVVVRGRVAVPCWGPCSVFMKNVFLETHAGHGIIVLFWFWGGCDWNLAKVSESVAMVPSFQPLSFWTQCPGCRILWYLFQVRYSSVQIVPP